ncbi:riboflavin synthase eubacterial/eukaryotic [Cutibacterium acnes JCM 18918]|nr:riboflavin synthase eubacterial/eukaryotic [Cutibacterium acnes JCM 18918]
MPVGDRLGGHIVQGHVDGLAKLVFRTPGDHWEVFRFALPAAVSRYVVEKRIDCDQRHIFDRLRGGPGVV